jgi:hypothetical protein
MKKKYVIQKNNMKSAGHSKSLIHASRHSRLFRGGTSRLCHPSLKPVTQTNIKVA